MNDLPLKIENGEGTSKQVTSAVPNTLEEMRKENLEMQVELKKRGELLAHRDELRAREILGGKSSAGTAIKPIEETPKDYAKRVMKGEFNKQ